MGKFETPANVAAIVESGAAVAALVLGGWWFLAQRENYSRIDLSQSAQVIPLGHGTIAIEAILNVKNAGMKQAKLHRARVRLQEASGWQFDYDQLAAMDGTKYWRALRPPITPDRRQFNAGELRWPSLKIFDGAIDSHIEPGETDTLIFTFLVPCRREVAGQTRSLHHLRLAADIFKPDDEQEDDADGQLDQDSPRNSTQPPKEFAWKARSFVDVTKECRK